MNPVGITPCLADTSERIHKTLMQDNYTTKNDFKRLVTLLERSNTIQKGEICAKLVHSGVTSPSQIASATGLSRQVIHKWITTYKQFISSEGGDLR